MGVNPRGDEGDASPLEKYIFLIFLCRYIYQNSHFIGFIPPWKKQKFTPLLLFSAI